MPSFTTWTRLEPRTADAPVETGYAARLHDPLWLLGRQWQVGEFQGEDGGTPVVARWRGQVAEMTRYRAGPVPLDTQLEADAFDPSLPLEALVECQSLRQPAGGTLGGLRLAVESGQHFLRLLRLQATAEDHGETIRRAYPVPPLTADEQKGLDPETWAFADLVANRALDARMLRAALGNPADPRIDRTLGITPGDLAEIDAACRAWIAWEDALFSQPEAGSETWQPDRLEYTFSISTRLGEDRFGERTLTAAQYDDGALDWYAFDVNGHVNMGTDDDPAGAVLTRTVVPAPVTFHGMPSSRFWELEDARIDLGALQPGATDLAQILLVETLTGFGNDWFVIPIDLPVGSLAETRSLVVTDTFGVRTLLRPLGDPALPDRASGWRMFALSHLDTPGGEPRLAASNLFFLPPTLAQPLEGPVLEEVTLARDELANLAWAIERRLESPLEIGYDTTVDMADADAGPPVPREPPHYRLATQPPRHWIPLIPVHAAPDSAEVRLARGAVLDLSGTLRPILAQARLIGAGDPGRLMIREEEVPREGLILRRTWQAARWHDGRLFVWTGNRVSVGRGESSSTVAFDTIEG
ncbi:MAG: hypothetical protein AAFX81_10745 [Pseudomonadota bacterium]